MFEVFPHPFQSVYSALLILIFFLPFNVFYFLVCFFFFLQPLLLPSYLAFQIYFFYYSLYSSYLSGAYTLFLGFNLWTKHNCTDYSKQRNQHLVVTARCEALVTEHCRRNTETSSQWCFTLTAMCKEEPRESWGALGVCGRTATLKTWLSRLACGLAELDTWEQKIHE